MIKKIGFTLVLLMALLQGFYGIFAFIDPITFSTVRGTDLVSTQDIDWIQIYASRTLFVALIIGVLIYSKAYNILMWAALFGVVMPITDGLLAYQAGAALNVVVKHGATVLYLLITFLVLRAIVNKDKGDLFR